MFLLRAGDTHWFLCIVVVAATAAAAFSHLLAADGLVPGPPVSGGVPPPLLLQPGVELSLGGDEGVSHIHLLREGAVCFLAHVALEEGVGAGMQDGHWVRHVNFSAGADVQEQKPLLPEIVFLAVYHTHPICQMLLLSIKGVRVCSHHEADRI